MVTLIRWIIVFYLLRASVQFSIKAFQDDCENSEGLVLYGLFAVLGFVCVVYQVTVACG